MAQPPEATFQVRLPSYYFNGFELGLSNADVFCTLALSNSQIASIYMSYTTAKSLAQKLTELVSHLERVTERQIMTTDDVAAGLEKLMSGDSR